MEKTITEKRLITSVYLSLHEHKLTQCSVAKSAGIDPSTLSNALRRKRGMSLSCFAKIVEAINELKPGAWTWPGN